MSGSTEKNRIRFNKTIVANLGAPDTERVYLYDTEERGLALCVTRAGSKTWYLYRKVLGRPERLLLGKWPDLTVENARKLASVKKGDIAKGGNPSDDRRLIRKAPTLQELFDDFLAAPTRTRAKRPKSAKTVHEYSNSFKAYLSDWAGRSIATITRTDVERRQEKLATESGIYQANRVVALLKAMFNHASDRRFYDKNPAAKLRMFEETQRERFLLPEELPRFFAALETVANEKHQDFFLVCLFTGARRGNVLSMRWEDVNFEAGVWSIQHTKSGKPHKVPLTTEVFTILARRRVVADPDNPYVFPGNHGTGRLTDPSPEWRRVCKAAGIDNLRIHDLRRSMGSWQTMTNASLSVVGKTLGHSRPETTAIYARLTLDPVKVAMQTATTAMMAAAKPVKAEGASNGEE